MVGAVAKQVVLHWAPDWERQPVDVLFYASLASVPTRVPIIAIFDNSFDAKILGYHAVTPDGRQYGRVFAGGTLVNGGALTEGHQAVSTVLSHELLELLGDPGANQWAFGLDGIGRAFELCDAVEDQAYDIEVDFGRKVAVSNYVLPSYFDPTGPGPWDRLRSLPGPLTLSGGGYEIVMQGGAVSQRRAATLEEPLWKTECRAHVASRTSKRQALARCAA